MIIINETLVHDMRSGFPIYRIGRIQYKSDNISSASILHVLSVKTMTNTEYLRWIKVSTWSMLYFFIKLNYWDTWLHILCHDTYGSREKRDKLWRCVLIGVLRNSFSSISRVPANTNNLFKPELETMYLSSLIPFANRDYSQQILGSNSDWIMQYDILRKLISA